ncbi:SusC/RagA family TonB-linked outer membrane protein [Segetibacter aerophilus]|uniref:SusC/RagA family TonB-linked outer membrane protein n=1 Tax=Segetibacter aerophilus TaxID=670293 RepID=A0A512BFY4_9BACT|nr:SusC/RagA family TonB-linked outer membrane protein [Segetibacter aerophilus]GEO10871.1 SusC/RagA family TonB-linked outer membrane protein [Segetibacter aerophilus]
MIKNALAFSNNYLLTLKKLIGLVSLIFILLSIDSTAAAQGNTVRGKITDSLANPIQGVSIVVKGSKNGTSSNAAGEFQLNGVAERSTLVVSFVGLATQEIRLGSGQRTINISMLPDLGTLQDVVVTGYQRIDKKRFTGSAVTLKAEDVKIEGVIDVSRMLEGRAAGVSVQNVSSTFGSAPKVRVRGATSINGENKPLWVVDGVVLEDIVNISNEQLSSGDPTTLLGSSVAGINANDIETFDILKDAAATALYGARAMNGVVVITTKKGRAGKPTVNYTGNFSTQLKPQYSNYNIMNSAQQMSVLGELERKGILQADILSRPDYGVYGKMFDLISTPDAYGAFPLANTTEAKSAFLKKYAAANTDWFDVLFKNSLTQEHSLSISSGTDKSQSFFSTSFYNDNGWTIADKVKRYTLNFRNNYNFSDKLSTGFMTVGSVRQQKAPGTLSRVSNPVSGQFDRDFDINPFSYGLNTSRTMTAVDDKGNLEFFRRNFAPFNIINELKNNYLDINVIDLKLQGELGYRFNKHLRYEFIGALRYVKSSREHQITENANMAQAYRANGNATIAAANKFLYTDPDNPSAPPVVVLPYGGFYNRTEDQLLNFDVRNSLNYTNTFNEKHNINILVGQQVKYADRQNFSNTGYGYQYENGGVPFVDYRILKQTIESSFPYYGMSKEYDRFAAFYLNSQYTFNKRYNFYGTVRYDGSNRLGSSPKARWLPTWSFGGAWNIEEEGFMENLTAIDFLKLRGSYGLTASLGPATNSNIVLRSITTNRTFPTERESVIRLANLENADLTWEKNYQTNLGLDGGLFKGRLNISLDVYQRNSFDLISIIKTPGIGGEALKAANYADMTSRGAEALIGGTIIRKKNWSWRTNFTIGYNETRITNVKNIPLIFDLVKAEGGNTQGYPVNSLFSINFKGLDHITGVPQFVNEKGEVSSNVYLQDQNTSNLVYEGPVDPTLTGGFSNTFNYKAFSLNVFVTYQAGNKIRLYPAFRTAYTDFDAMPKEFNDRWVMPGDEKLTNVPSIVDAYQRYILGGTGAYPYNNYNYSTARIADGGFVRLKTVSLTYNVTKQTLDRIGFKSLAVTAVAANPWLIYSDPKLKGQDPEFFNSGGVAQPIQKQFTLSLKVGL